MLDSLEDDIRNLLKELGLSSFEQKAYTYLLKVGSGASAQEISNNANIPLTRVYGVMRQLQEKGAVSIDRLSNPTNYYPRDPESALRYILRKYRTQLDGKAERLEVMLDNLLRNLKLPSLLGSEWGVCRGDDVYRSLIPSLVAASKRDALIVSSNVSETMTKEFLDELSKGLDRGIVVKILVSADASSFVNDFAVLPAKVFGPEKLAEMIRDHGGKNLLMRKHERNNIVPFGIFDRSRVCFSVTSPKDGRYLVTLVTDDPVIDEFYDIFQDAWESSAEFEAPYTFANTHSLK